MLSRLLKRTKVKEVSLVQPTREVQPAREFYQPGAVIPLRADLANEGQYVLATSLSRVEANVGAIARRFEEQVANLDKLNRALGEFREQQVKPLAEELKHLRYGMGAKVEQTTTELAGVVNHLDKALTAIFKAQGWSDEAISAYKTQYGLNSTDAPRAAEFAAYAERIAELREAYEQLLVQNHQLIEQNQRLTQEIEARQLPGDSHVKTPAA